VILVYAPLQETRVSDPARDRNDDFAWARFDPEAYVAHYYGDPHPDDDDVVRRTSAALAAPGRDDLEIVDVGTGPNLFPLLAALPFARKLTVWEYAESNIAWLRRELARDALRAPWTHFWEVAAAAHGRAHGAVQDPAAALRARTEIVQGSIFDLPSRRWDAATMFFCAESITARQDEFERACEAFARAAKPGGVLAAAFLAGSRGYEVGDRTLSGGGGFSGPIAPGLSRAGAGRRIGGDRRHERRDPQRLHGNGVSQRACGVNGARNSPV
jgi:hypothetical protein